MFTTSLSHSNVSDPIIATEFYLPTGCEGPSEELAQLSCLSLQPRLTEAWSTHLYGRPSD